MKDFINIKQVAICAGIVLLIAVVSVITIYWEPDVKNTTLLSSGDTEMTLDEGIFLTKNKQAYYEAYYLANGYTINWDSEYEDGQILKDIVLEESLDFVKQIFLFSEYAKAQGMTLTDEEKSGITASAQEFLSDSRDNVLKATNASTDLVTRVYTRTAYHDKVCNMIYEDTDLTVTEEEARQCLVAAVEISPSYFDSPERTAQKIMERVNNGEIITEVATIYDTKATKGNVGKGDMSGNALEQLCLSLKDGQCEITEIDGTYFVVYCYLANDEEATEIAKENIIAERQTAAINSFFENLLKDMPIEVNMKAWETINFDEHIITEKDLESVTSTEE